MKPILDYMGFLGYGGCGSAAWKDTLHIARWTVGRLATEGFDT